MKTSSSLLKRGFTLVELLVVMSIISLLIAILLPSLSGSRDMARLIQCAANQRGIGIAQANYNANDKFDAVAPYRTNTYRIDRLEIYLERGSYPAPNGNRLHSLSWLCPENQPPFYTADAQGGYEQNFISFRPNQHLIILNPTAASGSQIVDIVRAGRIAKPSNKISFVEVRKDVNSAGVHFRTICTDNASFNNGYFHMGRLNGTDFTDGKMNVLYVDGHVNVSQYRDAIFATNSATSAGYIKNWDPRVP